jgi:hypothetical protein
MNTLEQIIEMWKKDCQIDELELDTSSRESAKLHSKYLELYSINKLKLKRLDNDFKVLLKNKWSYDPLDGLTILKGDMDKFYDADPLIQEHQAKMQYTQELIDTLKEILENIKWRHQNIKNIIEWNKFTSGM